MSMQVYRFLNLIMCYKKTEEYYSTIHDFENLVFNQMVK